MIHHHCIWLTVRVLYWHVLIRLWQLFPNCLYMYSVCGQWICSDLCVVAPPCFPYAALFVCLKKWSVFHSIGRDCIPFVVGSYLRSLRVPAWSYVGHECWTCPPHTMASPLQAMLTHFPLVHLWPTMTVGGDILAITNAVLQSLNGPGSFIIPL